MSYLEALFDRILSELDPEFLDHAIRYFKLMEASHKVGPVNVMVFSYADEENDMVGIDYPVSPLDKKTYENRRDRLKRRLNSLCMGLLEITEQPPSGHAFVDSSQSRVNYLHRTVGDYIAREEVWERLVHRAGQVSHQRFDPHLRLCSSELAYSKSSPMEAPIPPRATRMVKESLRNCLCHAAKVQKPGLQSMIRLLDELGNDGEAIYFRLTRALDLSDPLAGPTLGLRLCRSSPFVAFVIKCGVVEYIRAKEVQEWSQTIRLWHKVAAPVRKRRLHAARAADVWSDLDWQLSHAVLSHSPSPAIVEILLERGADLQYTDPLQGLSTWVITLMVYMRFWHEEPQTRQQREETVALMIKYGAAVERKTIMKARRKLLTPVESMVPDEVDFVSTVEKELKNMRQRIL